MSPVVHAWKQSQASTSTANLASTSRTQAFLASRSSWVIDSGASTHMTGTPSTLSSLTPTTAYPPVSIADGRSCYVKGYGSTKPTPSLTLHNVLYVPGFPTNLLSISTITHTLNCVTIFYPFHCVFQDLRTSQRIGLGRENDCGIYELMLDTPSSGLLALFSSSSATSILSHHRLGHHCLSKLKQTLTWLSLTECVCESCQMGKHHRLTYPAHDSIPSSRAFDLIHCDVWGPSRVPSPSGHLYYIVFVDDYTRVSWVYLINDHRQVLDIFCQFILEIITQHSTTPKVIRTDNALELIQSALQQFCVDHGIIHQTTFPYTSSQNGVVERKHRILLDITRTLLYEMYVPHYLWSDVIVTATYLHNRLPSSPLGGAIPLTRLFPNASLFPLPLRVFGCTTFVQDYTPSLSKLAPRALKGVFVGYSRTQKGYRVYFLDTRRYITSADVTFHEDVPYFSSSTTPLKAPISPPCFPSIPPSSLSPSLGISTTPSTLPLTLLTSNDCLTPPSLVI